MGLIIFILCVPILAIAIATYLLVRGESVPPYQSKVETQTELNPHWPFPNGPKP